MLFDVVHVDYCDANRYDLEKELEYFQLSYFGIDNFHTFERTVPYIDGRVYVINSNLSPIPGESLAYMLSKTMAVIRKKDPRSNIIIFSSGPEQFNMSDDELTMVRGRGIDIERIVPDICALIKTGKLHTLSPMRVLIDGVRVPI